MATLRSPDTTAHRPFRPALLLAVLFLVALNLRAAITSLPPLSGTIEDDLGLSGLALGLLTTLPVVCMGAFAPLAQRVADRYGRETAVMAALTVLTAALLARLAGSQITVLFASALAVGAGIAVIQTLVPGIVKEHFGNRAGRATGVYSTGMSVGATVAASMAVPLDDLTGSWQVSLATWSVFGILGLVVWFPVVAGAPRRAGVPRPAPQPLPWRSRTAWLVAGYLVCQSTLFYSQVAWIPAAYQDEGWSEQRSGVLFAVYNAANLAAALLVPALADRFHDRRPLLLTMLGLTLAGLFTLSVTPLAAPWLFVAVLGIGQGGGFVLALVLLVDYAPDPAASGRLSGMGFLVGYSAAAVGPALLGGLRDLTGGFTVPFAALVALDLAQILVVVRLRPTLRV